MPYRVSHTGRSASVECIWKIPVKDNIHYFTDRPENACLEDGKLHIIALEESYQGYSYTSALLKTSRSVYWRYGRIEACIKLPATNGLVPAFWMLPEDELYRPRLNLASVTVR